MSTTTASAEAAPAAALSAPAPLSAPASLRSTSLDGAGRRNFLADVVIEHGPRDILGRLFLRADTALRQHGVFLSFGDCSELVAINRQNPESWSTILPLFDPEVSDAGAHNCVVLVGRNAAGRAIFAHASRRYSLQATTIKDEIESLRLFYRDPARSAWPGEAMHCSASVAQRPFSNVVFGGALWLHPNYRGREIQRLTGPIMRCLSYTRWMPELTFSFMVQKLVAAGVAANAKLHVEQEVTMINTPVKRDGALHAAFVWIAQHEQAALFGDYLESLSLSGDTKVDRAVVQGAAKEKRIG